MRTIIPAIAIAAAFVSVTAWNYPTVAVVKQSVSINPNSMMAIANNLPVQQYDAF